MYVCRPTCLGGCGDHAYKHRSSLWLLRKVLTILEDFTLYIAIIDTASPEYVALKALLADVVDLLAGNAPVITQFSNHLFSSGLIPKAVHLNPKSSPLDRASQLINAALLAIESHPEPRSQFLALVASLQKVGLNQMTVKLQHNLGKPIKSVIG